MMWKFLLIHLSFNGIDITSDFLKVVNGIRKKMNLSTTTPAGQMLFSTAFMWKNVDFLTAWNTRVEFRRTGVSKERKTIQKIKTAVKVSVTIGRQHPNPSSSNYNYNQPQNDLLSSENFMFDIKKL